MFNIRLFALGIIFIAFVPAAYAATLISCHDGDNCRFQTPAGVVNARFWGIDAPELKQPFGPEARDYAAQLMTGQDVALRCRGKSFDRQVCSLSVNSQSIQDTMVKAGLAWDDPRYSKGQFSASQRAAQQSKRGLWSQSNPQAPKCYRRKTTAGC